MPFQVLQPNRQETNRRQSKVKEVSARAAEAGVIRLNPSLNVSRRTIPSNEAVALRITTVTRVEIRKNWPSVLKPYFDAKRHTLFIAKLNGCNSL
jgi:hypothetical protein